MDVAGLNMREAFDFDQRICDAFWETGVRPIDGAQAVAHLSALRGSVFCAQVLASSSIPVYGFRPAPFRECWRDINPIEQVWNHAKQHQVAKQVIVGPDHLKRLVLSALHCIQKSTAIIKGFFRHPDYAYAMPST
ncbi:hypothetical protein [Acidihalobacter ferrooxydans]|uniref:Transposase n=1 Tax=Acidihalobacter ferrooxydans TaxID=1765967 RepID=A0A1P8UE69_9GAMM|nr:hypothetical protein [Acidihalobacter ferrooxydans]APZ42110.1 hypothetical protein BW247_02540 [Acidihalobacter ferrooxydans]